MTSILEYTADSSPLLREWRKQGSAPAEFLAEVRKHRRYQGISWRGCSFESVKRFSPILSTSQEIQVAHDFCSYHYNPAVVAFIGYEGYNISLSSCHQEEDEILLVLEQHFDAKYVTRLEQTPVFLACNTSNSRQWEQEVKYQVNRFQTFLEDYEL
jgi:hypothetical protein